MDEILSYGKGAGMTPTRRTPPIQAASASQQPSADDVRRFIAERQTPQPPTGTQELPLTPELNTYIKEVEKGAAGSELPMPDIPTEPGATPDITGEAALRETALQVEGAADITQDDKDAYVKATLFDMPLVLSIPVLGGKGVATVRTLSITHEDVLAWWLASLEKDGTITTQARWLVMMQRAHVLLRVVSLKPGDQEEVTPYSCAEVEAVVAECSKYKMQADPGGGMLEPVKGIGVSVPVDLYNRAISTLQQHVSNTFRGMQPARYALLQMAVAEHEKKFNALTRLAASGNF